MSFRREIVIQSAEERYPPVVHVQENDSWFRRAGESNSSARNLRAFPAYIVLLPFSTIPMQRSRVGDQEEFETDLLFSLICSWIPLLCYYRKLTRRCIENTLIFFQKFFYINRIE